MKKSEMFDEMKACYDEYIDDYGVLYVLEKILYRQECKGMLPPERKNENFDSKKYMKFTEHPFLEYEEERYVRKWEKEDE